MITHSNILERFDILENNLNWELSQTKHNINAHTQTELDRLQDEIKSLNTKLTWITRNIEEIKNQTKDPEDDFKKWVKESYPGIGENTILYRFMKQAFYKEGGADVRQ